MKKKQNLFYIVVSLVCLVLIFVFGRNIKTVFMVDNSSTQRITPNPINTDKTNKDSRVTVTISVETLEDYFEEKAFLVTEEYFATQLETYNKDKKIAFLTSESQFIYSYEVSVEAGIDCAKISFDIDNENEIIYVDLPDSEISSTQINRDSFMFYSEKESVWNPLKLEDYHNAETELEKKTIENAKKNGILERANERAKDYVEDMIKIMPNTDSYKIVFK